MDETSKYTLPQKVPITVAYKKRTGKKVWLKTFTNLVNPDRIITNRSTLLPPGTEIVEIGIGYKFEELYKKKFKI